MNAEFSNAMYFKYLKFLSTVANYLLEITNCSLLARQNKTKTIKTNLLLATSSENQYLMVKITCYLIIRHLL